MPLTPREQRIIAEIQRDLIEKDPDLAGALSNPHLMRDPGLKSAALRHTILLVTGLAVLALLSPVAVQLGAPAVAVLTAAVVVPWMVSAARLARRYRDDAELGRRRRAIDDVGGRATPDPRVVRERGPWPHRRQRHASED
jgi:Flp pilus assembly protein TadB